MKYDEEKVQFKSSRGCQLTKIDSESIFDLVFCDSSTYAVGAVSPGKETSAYSIDSVREDELRHEHDSSQSLDRIRDVIVDSSTYYDNPRPCLQLKYVLYDMIPAKMSKGFHNWLVQKCPTSPDRWTGPFRRTVQLGFQLAHWNSMRASFMGPKFENRSELSKPSWSATSGPAGPTRMGHARLYQPQAGNARAERRQMLVVQFRQCSLTNWPRGSFPGLTNVPTKLEHPTAISPQDNYVPSTHIKTNLLSHLTSHVKSHRIKHVRKYAECDMTCMSISNLLYMFDVSRVFNKYVPLRYLINLHNLWILTNPDLTKFNLLMSRILRIIWFYALTRLDWMF